MTPVNQTVRLTAEQARRLALDSLLLGASRTPTTVCDVVTWFGAMQAQELSSAEWSLGIRLPASTLASVNAALEHREALRTWPMRGTIHWVPARDARWMLELMGVRALAGAERRRNFLGLDEATANRAVEVIGAALVGGGRLTRAECLGVWERAGIASAGQLGYHLLWYASQRGVTCIAPNVDGDQTFVLLDEWVPTAHHPQRDEALGLIATRYFQSHGPAPRQDLAGWTGLTMADVKRAIEVVGGGLEEVSVEGTSMYVAAGATSVLSSPSSESRHPLQAVPGFDEFLLGYKDRSLMVADEHKQAIIPGGNGIFRWTIVRDGQVIGTWKRNKSRTKTIVEVLPVVPVTAGTRKAVATALQPYAQFVGREIEVHWP